MLENFPPCIGFATSEVGLGSDLEKLVRLSNSPSCKSCYWGFLGWTLDFINWLMAILPPITDLVTLVTRFGFSMVNPLLVILMFDFLSFFSLIDDDYSECKKGH